MEGGGREVKVELQSKELGKTYYEPTVLDA